MPLLDHFHPPLKGKRHWESFHGRWAAAMADALNEDLLPEDYFAEFQIHIGSRVEVDVGTFEEEAAAATRRGDGSTALMAARVWTPSTPTWVLPAIFPDELEVQVFSTVTGPTLVAAVELVSPGNKDRPEFRRAFVAKCASYLQQGIGLIIVDVVTERQANLHNELVEFLGHSEGHTFEASAKLYGVAYRPARRKAVDQIDIWPATFNVGQALTTLPLALRGAECVPLDLETTYMETCRKCRLL